ncbi:MAG TPA: TonB-dependent receptor [Terriglobales bacterium]|nr:TonB-dependent receptor [Terriglobales bacterium]
MRFSRVFAHVFFLSSILPTVLLAGASAEIRIKVVDPQGAAVAGAQVQLLSSGKTALIDVLNTSAEGTATFRGMPSSSYRVQVLAPGFAADTIDLTSTSGIITLQLHIATAAETVVVTATRTLVTGEAGGADVTSLTNAQLEVMNSTAGSDTLRFLPGAVVNSAGQRGGLSSLFVRGGDSTYNKVIVDGVTINEPGGTFDFGTLPLTEVDRVEFVRGAQSTLYGSDAMTSVVQMWTRTGSTHIPELRFGADGGNFGTANGYGLLAGAYKRFDYNAFANQYYTDGQGINDFYSDSLQGANVGVALTDEVNLRVRVRHSNSHTGIPGEWSFNGNDPLVPSNGPNEPFVPLQPDPNEWSQYNNILGSIDLAIATRNGWQHHFTGFDYLYRYNELNLNGDAARVDPFGDPIDFASHEVDRINRVGFEYQGDYSERSWAHTTFGYRIENENGFVGDVNFGQTPGQRLNDDLYIQQQITYGRLTAIAGGRFVHNSAFGNIGVPRIALTLLALRGGDIFSGTRLRFSYSGGFKEPRLEETYAGRPFSDPNPGLKPERVRAFEAGIRQDFFKGKYALNATYFNNLFRDQINYVEVDPVNFIGEYVNVNKAFAQGAEIELQARLRSRLSLNAAYTYTSTEILENPAPIDGQYLPGSPLLRRPKHSGTTLLSYLGSRWAANVGGSFVGRRADDDFDNFEIHHAAGYARVDLGGWYAINSRVTAYVNVENALNAHYNEVVGYPALSANFRAGFRFRIGGE